MRNGKNKTEDCKLGQVPVRNILQTGEWKLCRVILYKGSTNTSLQLIFFTTSHDDKSGGFVSNAGH